MVSRWHLGSKTVILSSRSDKIKRLAKLVQKTSFRSQEQAFVVEGPRSIEAALRAKADLEAIYFATNLHGSHQSLIRTAFDRGYPVFEVESKVLESVLDPANAQPIAAIARIPNRSDLNRKYAGPVVVLDELRDPGNAGTILRSAHAVGVSSVFFLPGSVDPYNPKVVRSSAGSIFFVEVLQPQSKIDILEDLKAQGYCILGTYSDARVLYSDADLCRPIAVVVGNEAFGITAEVSEMVDLMVAIPTAPSLESLNASMAATVLLFEAMRQRGL